MEEKDPKRVRAGKKAAATRKRNAKKSAVIIGIKDGKQTIAARIGDLAEFVLSGAGFQLELHQHAFEIPRATHLVDELQSGNQSHPQLAVITLHLLRRDFPELR
mgnify:CR=1 FL=1